MALILNAEWRRSLIVCLAGIPVRIGLNRKKSRFFLTRSVPVSRDLQHFTKEHLSLVDESEDCLPRLELNSEEKRIWLEWSRKTTWEKDTYIVIHPFSGDELKTWPIDNWIQLLQELYTEGKVKRFVVICGPGEEVLLHEMVTNLPSAPLQIMAGGSLMAVKAVIGNALALVGGDSGPGHVAAALGTPVLSLFGSTNPERSRPLGHTALAVILKNFIGSIAVGEVKEKLLALLDKKVLHV
jgi:ADP-heptose:LPS heptosyltransferase